MATIRRKHREPVRPLQRDPGPWSRLVIDWLATLAVIMVFGLVMLFSASYTTGYLRMGDSFHYIKQQALCMMIGLGCMFVMSYMNDTQKRTLPIAISGFFGQHQFTQWGYVFAMSVASLLPVLIIFICCQKYFVSGSAIISCRQ